jgi:hypothetical protein
MLKKSQLIQRNNGQFGLELKLEGLLLKIYKQIPDGYQIETLANGISTKYSIDSNHLSDLHELLHLFGFTDTSLTPKPAEHQEPKKKHLLTLQELKLRNSLNSIYEQDPSTMNCEPCCGNCCSRMIPCEKAETKNIRVYCVEHGIPFKELNGKDNREKCPYQQSDYKCIVYPVRPLRCRLLGNVQSLQCPILRGNPSTMLTNAQAASLLTQVKVAHL